MKDKGISTLKVAATYIGTVVGAGFATGQEILQFFNMFGKLGLLGLILTTLMFIVFGCLIMSLGNKLNAKSHLEVIRHSGGKVFGNLMDFIITFFLFGALSAMIAGTGSIFVQQFNLPSLLGNLIMAIITALTVLTGIDGIIKSISFVVPFLLLSVIAISIYSIVNNPIDINSNLNTINENSLMPNFLIAAILYVSYNIILSISILGPLGVKAKHKKTIRNGAILGGLGLGLGSILIYFTLMRFMGEVANIDVPMIYVASKISPIIQIMYAIILIAEIYTTAVGSLYGFVYRINNKQKHPSNIRVLVITSTALALLVSQLGFTSLIKYLYPLVGIAGLLLLISLIINRLKEKGYLI